MLVSPAAALGLGQRSLGLKALVYDWLGVELLLFLMVVKAGSSDHVGQKWMICFMVFLTGAGCREGVLGHW